MAYSLFNSYYIVLLDRYCYQTTNNLKKFIKQNDKKNSSIIAISIVLVIGIYRAPTRLLKKNTLIPNMSSK